MAAVLFCMMAMTAIMPSAVGADGDSFWVERHPPGAPSTDIVYNEWQAPSDGEVYLEIHNAGMASVTIGMVDDASNTLLSQTIRFQGDGSAVIPSTSVSVTGGTMYTFSAIPGGPPGCGGTLLVCFEPTSAPSTVTYRIYDMFEEPWGPWWDYRVDSSTWDTERILPTSSGDVTYLYSLLHNPSGDLSDQGLIYAPYRYSVDAVNLGTMNVHDPVLMPTVGSAVAGAAVSMDVYFQYLYMDGGDWTNVWIPEYGTAGEFATVSGISSDPSTWVDDVETTHLAYNDGYMTGTLIEVTMNREAAEEWLGMPQTADPLSWWASEGDDYLLDWEAWILTQGNDVFDIWCGYEWPYETLGTVVKLGMDGDDVVLNIGHVSWGYEALITRWMVHADVSMHQPYMEDFAMTVDYRESDVDLAYDGVAQWSLHCVKQYDAPNEPDAPCAWAWEPIALDYVTKVNHPSDYEPYVDLEYTSWNCGDVGYGTKVGYEYTPVEMDLAVGRMLVIEFPTDAVVGYSAEQVPADSILKVWNGDLTEYTSRQYYGPMSLGYMNLNGNGYTLSGNVLTIEGPADFAYPHPDNMDCLYHGAPWIEFNVDL
ncbi:MAG: hypothetical protein JSV90_04335 [Methanobacteriota archaeon]|nr:MAG: hypothetical protein JSV90_04335 [Euryarchaeota archaeon]